MFVSFIKICSCNDLHLASNEAKQSCKVVNLLQCFECTGPPLELIQLPAKKHSLTTDKEKKNLIAGRQPGFSPTHGCISVFARVSSNLFLLPQSLMPNVQLSKRVSSLFST